MKKTENGFFIAFEGIDGCGKSTHMKIVAEHLTSLGFDVITTREPGGTKLAERIREILLDNSLSGRISPMAELMLYLASRAQHSSEIIAPHLEKGGVVLTDRFADSSVAYQGGARNLGMELVEELCSHVIPRWPDLTLFLDVPPEESIRRMNNRTPDRLEEEGLTFLREVRDAYLKLIENHPDRFFRIDSSNERSVTAKKVIEVIDNYIGKNNLL